VSEVHLWNNRKNRTAGAKDAPVPSTLNYDLWLGPVPAMPFKSDYHPYNWRRYWAFGSGMLGDIGCHLMDVAFWALDLKYPTRISAEGGPALDDDVTAEWIVATYDFPARGEKPAVKMTWYDPPKTPPMLSQWNLPPNLAGEGVMFIGEGGRMLFTNYGEHALLPQAQFANFTRPPQTIPKSPGHQAEWIDACLNGDPSATSTPFSYAGSLTEAALLGTIAYRAQKPLEWDAANLRFTNAPDAEKLLSREYREGWSL
jgi:predicted dehydrogenase